MPRSDTQYSGVLSPWHGCLNCFLNLTLALHLNRRDSHLYLKSWKPISARDDGKPSFLLIGWHLFKEICNLVASMDSWLWIHSWKVQDVPRGNTALWCKQDCSGSLPFLSFSLSLSLGLSLSSYFSLSAVLLYVPLLNVGPCWVSLGDEMALNRNVKFKILMVKKKQKYFPVFSAFSCLLYCSIYCKRVKLWVCFQANGPLLKQSGLLQ